MRFRLRALSATTLIWSLPQPSAAEQGWTELDLSGARIVAAQTGVLLMAGPAVFSAWGGFASEAGSATFAVFSMA